MTGAAYVPRHRRLPDRTGRRVTRRLLALSGVLALQVVPFAAGEAPAQADTRRVAKFDSVAADAAIDPVHRWFYEGTGVGQPLRIRSVDTLKVLREVTPLAFAPGTTIPAVLAADPKAGHALIVNYSPTDGAHLGVVAGASGKLLSNATLTPPVGAAVGGAWTVKGVTADPKTGDVLTAWALSGAYNPPGANAQLYVAQHDATTGALKWAAAVPQCTSFVGTPTPVGRNAESDAVYVACTANRTFVVRFRQPGPAKAPTVTETFQVPGTLAGAGFATASERMYLQSSTAYAQGVLVFDGRHSKTIGLIPGGGLGVPGVDPSTGRMYACAGIFGLLVADAGRATPVPLGDQFPSVACSSRIAPLVDPVTHRVFVYTEPAQGNSSWDVVRDEVPAYVETDTSDPDAATVNLPEKAGVTGANSNGTGAAYGSEVVLVGGPTGTEENLAGGYAYQLAQILNSFTYALTCNPPNPATGCRAVSVTNLGYANREIWRSRVSSAHLEDGGATATASSADRNAYVDSDVETMQNPEVPGGAPTPTPSGGPEKAKWPIDRVECREFEGGSNNVHHANADGADVTCDRGKSVVVTVRDSQEAPSASAALFTVGSTSANVSVVRDPKLGVVTTSRSEARNILLGGGLVRIGAVVSKVVSSAHGRPGTARTVYSRDVSGVTVVDQSGKKLFQCTTTDDCEEDSQHMIRTINSALGNRVRVFLPKANPALYGSPRGAQALLARDEWEQLEEQTLNGLPPDDHSVAGMEIHFVADNLGQSRMLLKLAGVEAESHYSIFKLPTDGVCCDTGPSAGPTPPAVSAAPSAAPKGGDTTGGDTTGGDGKGTHKADGPGKSTITTILENIRSGLRWVFGAGNGFLLRLSAWSLLLIPAYVGIRRRAYYRRALTAVAR
jgi:hypothetical protein